MHRTGYPSFRAARFLPGAVDAACGAVARIARGSRENCPIVDPRPGYFTEPSIAVNPRNPQQVVGVFQDNAHAATP